MADGKSIGELFVEIGAEIIGGSQLSDFIKTLGQGSISAYGMVGVLEQMSVKLHELAEVVMQAAMGFEMFESTTGLSAKQLQQWQGAAFQANISAETVTSSIEALGQKLANIRYTGQGIKPFQIMGIDPRQDPFAVLNQMRTWAKAQKDVFFAGNMLEEAGVSRQMLQLFRLSDSEFANFTRHATVMTSAQENNFNRLTLALRQMHEILMKMGYALMEYVIPPVTHAVNIFNELLTTLLRFKTEVMTFGVSLAAGLALANPELVAMAAAFGLLFLIMDDIAVYMEGGDSLMGRFMKWMQSMPRLMGPLKAFFEGMKLWLEGLISPINLLMTFFEKLESIASKGSWLKRFEGAVSDAKAVFERIPSLGLGLNQPFGAGAQTNNYDVDVNVHSSGPLDAPGWGDVSWMMKKAVMDASVGTHR